MRLTSRSPAHLPSGSTILNQRRPHKASPVAMSSIAARLTPMDACSSTRSMHRPSRSMQTTGESSGARSSATSHKGETMTMAPLVVKDKVLVGNSGGEFGVRGWLTALDAATGKLAVARLQHGPRQRSSDRPALQTVLSRRIAARISACTPGRRTRGRSAAARCGAGSPTTRELSHLLRHGESGPVESRAAPGRQQVDRRAFLRAIPILARRAGSTR